MIMHLLPLGGGLLLNVIHVPIPFIGLFITLFLPFVGGVVAPFVFWHVKKDESTYLNAVGKEVVNFQITAALIGVVDVILCGVCIGFPLLYATRIAVAVLVILAAVAANRGEFYRYPYILRLIK